MILEVGKRYVNVRGETFQILEHRGDQPYPMVGQIVGGTLRRSFTEHGNYDVTITGRNDLIKEVDEDGYPVVALAEADPTGRTANEPGSKLDAGKTRVALVLKGFSRALERVAEIGTIGASKYTPNGWMEVPNGQERYEDAAFRHLMKAWQGQPLDDGPGGTGKKHKAQVIWNLLAELELEERSEEKAKQ